MSNHSGSYMLSQILDVLEEHQVFALLGQRQTQELVAEIVRVARQYDCNSGEILEDHGERLGLCHGCLQPTKAKLQYGVCPTCLRETN